MAQSVKEFCDLLARSRLQTPETVQAMALRWQTVAVNPSSLPDFTGWLVAKEYLTEYQVKLLQEGRPDNFFIHQYKILDRIGKGRMAGVYQALDLQGQPVAIKVLPPSRAKNPAVVARFQRETRLALQLHHPSVVRTFDFGQHKSLHYLVMEHLEGETLQELLRERGRLTPKEAARIGFLTALGLQYIHEHGIVHRDLKPANLMLCPAPPPQENTLRSMVKILDIGLGRELFNPDDAGQDLTSEGAILGTPDYLAPEQARDARRVDIRADIYSLGCTLYHVLAGQTPFPDDNLVRQCLRHATQQPQPLAELNPRVPDGLSQVVLTMMAKQPDQRYQMPGEAALALKGFLAAAP